MVEQVIGRSDVSVVSNPEFLREGTAVLGQLHPDRIVVGAEDPQAAAMVGELFSSTAAPLIVTDATTSETIKYASNAFLATKLSFVNALAGLCEEVGADARDVLLGLGYDKRIGFEFLRPGPGWGGSCLPKDTRALLHTAGEAGYDFSLLAGAIESNEQQLVRGCPKVADACGGAIRGSTLAVWGLTFKANTDDRRDSPSLEICHRLAALGATVQAFDPTVDPETEADDLDGLRLSGDPYEAVTGAQVRVDREWTSLGWLDFSRVLATMRQPIVDATCSTRRAGARMASPTPGTRGDERRVVAGGEAGFLGSHLCDHLVLVATASSARRPPRPDRRTTWPTRMGHESPDLVVTDARERGRRGGVRFTPRVQSGLPGVAPACPAWPLATLAVGSEGTLACSKLRPKRTRGPVPHGLHQRGGLRG